MDIATSITISDLVQERQVMPRRGELVLWYRRLDVESPPCRVRVVRVNWTCMDQRLDPGTPDIDGCDYMVADLTESERHLFNIFTQATNLQHRQHAERVVANHNSMVQAISGVATQIAQSSYQGVFHSCHGDAKVEMRPAPLRIRLMESRKETARRREEKNVASGAGNRRIIDLYGPRDPEAANNEGWNHKMPTVFKTRLKRSAGPSRCSNETRRARHPACEGLRRPAANRRPITNQATAPATAPSATATSLRPIAVLPYSKPRARTSQKPALNKQAKALSNPKRGYIDPALGAGGNNDKSAEKKTEKLQALGKGKTTGTSGRTGEANAAYGVPRFVSTKFCVECLNNAEDQEPALTPHPNTGNAGAITTQAAALPATVPSAAATSLGPAAARLYSDHGVPTGQKPTLNKRARFLASIKRNEHQEKRPQPRLKEQPRELFRVDCRRGAPYQIALYGAKTSPNAVIDPQDEIFWQELYEVARLGVNQEISVIPRLLPIRPLHVAMRFMRIRNVHLLDGEMRETNAVSDDEYWAGFEEN
ncbi:hypothetical protein F4821DRAFT_255328 [Hypoxylon rubiginosum]|uniref:Uncharacterized protein n=1 Tax=Hypoxylon rubiginosum TaxID=110542 RepID=A0ACC0DEB7_9PEZI|nr:hypothetical protein F4821DRAFT_255328 [Hypoxylon rubiginosum]